MSNETKTQFEDFVGEFGGKLDGWFSPAKEEKAEVQIQGIIVDYISKDRSTKLQSDSVVLELTAPLKKLAKHSGSSETLKGEKGDMVDAPVGTRIAVPMWKQLIGLYPEKCGHEVIVKRSAKARPIGKGRSMYDVSTKVSTAKVRNISGRAISNASTAAADAAAAGFVT